MLDLVNQMSGPLRVAKRPTKRGNPDNCRANSENRRIATREKLKRLGFLFVCDIDEAYVNQQSKIAIKCFNCPEIIHPRAERLLHGHSGKCHICATRDAHHNRIIK